MIHKNILPWFPSSTALCSLPTYPRSLWSIPTINTYSVPSYSPPDPHRAQVSVIHSHNKYMYSLLRLLWSTPKFSGIPGSLWATAACILPHMAVASSSSASFQQAHTLVSSHATRGRLLLFLHPSGNMRCGHSGEIEAENNHWMDVTSLCEWPVTAWPPRARRTGYNVTVDP